MDTGPGQQDAVYRFAGFALDPVRAALRGPDGTAIEPRPKSCAVLLHLVRNPGRLVTREALLDAVWPDVAVGDEALTQCVRDVRRALGEAGLALLRTLPRRGYMLDAVVEVGSPETRGLAPAAGVPDLSGPPSLAPGDEPGAIVRGVPGGPPREAAPPPAEVRSRPPWAWPEPWTAGLILAPLLAGGVASVRAPPAGGLWSFRRPRTTAVPMSAGCWCCSAGRKRPKARSGRASPPPSPGTPCSPSGTPTSARPNPCSGATKRRWRPSAAASTAGGWTTGPPCWG